MIDDTKSHRRRRRRPTNNNTMEFGLGGAPSSKSTPYLLLLSYLSSSTMMMKMTIANAQSIDNTTISTTTTTTNNNVFSVNNRVIVTKEAMGARCAVSADFDGDGLQDLVSASSNDNAVSWFRNLGTDSSTGLPTFSIKNEISWNSKGSRIVTVGDVGKSLWRYLLKYFFIAIMCILL